MATAKSMRWGGISCLSPFPLSMSSLTDFRRLFSPCTPPFFAHFQSRLFPRDYAGVDRREETRRNVHFPLAKLGQCQLPSEEKRGAGEKTAGEKRSSGNTGVRGRTPDRGQAKERRGDRNGRDRSNQRSGSGQPGPRLTPSPCFCFVISLVAAPSLERERKFGSISFRYFIVQLNAVLVFYPTVTLPQT